MVSETHRQSLDHAVVAFLKCLEDAGIIESSVYRKRPVRYAYMLSEKGAELGNVLLGAQPAKVEAPWLG